MSHFDDMDMEELQSYFSDFHKDYYGFRPRGVYTPAEWQDREVLIKAINAIHDEFDARKQTAEGRESLRAEGWVLDESEFFGRAAAEAWSGVTLKTTYIDIED